MIRTVLAVALVAQNLIAPACHWKQYRCPTGMMHAEAATAKRDVEDGTIYVEIPGTVACGVPAPGPQFALTIFSPADDVGRSSRGLLVDYASPTGPTGFQVRGRVRPGEAIGVCLMTSFVTRLWCVVVIGVSTEPPAVVADLPTTDPLVRRRMVLDVNAGGLPNCAACWSAVG